jgi:6-pyruvoyl-tetrahydropterin synthase
MAVLISANTADFSRQLAATRRDLTGFTSSVTKMAGLVGVAFSVKEIASFGFELSKLSGEAAGVQAAFNKLPNSVKLMEDLKRVTGGTVSELDLMKRAVQASNFDISLEALPRLLQFATVRAQQTGQSVDYLVDSIVTGIGRKSKLILDNLGISAVQLGEKLKGVGTETATVADVARAVGEIAEESLSKTGELMDTTSVKAQRMAASWENVKVSLGDLVNNVGVPGWLDSINEGLEQMNQGLKFGVSEEGLRAYIDMFNRMQPEGNSFLHMLKRIEDDAAKLGLKLVGLKDNATGIYKVFIDERDKPTWVNASDEDTKKLVNTLDALKEKQKELNEQFDQTDLNDEKKLNNIASEIIAVQKLIEKYEALKKQKTSLAKPATDTATLSDRGLFTGSTQPNNPMRTSPFSNKFFNPEIKTSDWTEESNEALRAYQDELMKTADVAQEVGSVIGSAFATAADGQNGFVRALAGLTKDIISMYLKQSIAAMIAASIKDPTTPLPLAKIGVAAAGIAAVNGLFSKIGSGSGVGASGGELSRNSRGAYNYVPKDKLEIVFSGTLEAQGDKLISKINDWQQKRGVSRG